MKEQNMRRWPDITDRLQIDPSAYISPHAYVHGTVTIGTDASVWPMAVIRGDEGEITIGARTNVQDGCILHADFDAYLAIGDEVTLGHGAIVHGCTVENGALIGAGAVVLNHAVIGAGAVLGARALVPEGMIVPPGTLALGMPAQIKALRPEHRERARLSVEHYVALKVLHQARDAE